MVEIRQLEAFDKAEMDTLLEPIFGDDARNRYMRALIGAEAADRERALHDTLPKPERIRLGAFDGERFVGCSSGWFEFACNFYMGVSAIAPEYRQQGIYTRMLNTIETAVRERGGLSISSQHVATNKAVLIAKLKLGYVIAGTEYNEQMGLLVRLVLQLSPPRRALFASRVGTLKPGETDLS
jgi:GNAT superfamily N-acetyltransferase